MLPRQWTREKYLGLIPDSCLQWPRVLGSGFLEECDSAQKRRLAINIRAWGGFRHGAESGWPRHQVVVVFFLFLFFNSAFPNQTAVSACATLWHVLSKCPQRRQTQARGKSLRLRRIYCACPALGLGNDFPGPLKGGQSIHLSNLEARGEKYVFAGRCSPT